MDSVCKPDSKHINLPVAARFVDAAPGIVIGSSDSLLVFRNVCPQSRPDDRRKRRQTASEINTHRPRPLRRWPWRPKRLATLGPRKPDHAGRGEALRDRSRRRHQWLDLGLGSGDSRGEDFSPVEHWRRHGTDALSVVGRPLDFQNTHLRV